MKAGAGRPVTVTHKVCVSQKELAQDRSIESGNGDD